MAGRDTKEVGNVQASNRVLTARELRPVVVAGDSLQSSGFYVQKAREHLRSIAGFNGLPAEFEANPRVSKTSGGAAVVHMRQQFKSIPVFQGAQAVRFGPSGDVESSTGITFELSEDTPVEPRLTAAQAVLAAAKHTQDLGNSLLGESDDFGNALDAPRINLDGFQPTVIAAFNDIPSQPTVLERGPFAYAIKASLIWYPPPPKPLLGWQIVLTMPQGAGQYLVVVDANSGNILYSRQLVDLLIARGAVYTSDGTARQLVTFPRPWSDYAVAFDPGAIPTGVPREPLDWVDDAMRDTRGNYTLAHLGDSGAALAATMTAEGAIFQPADPMGDEQKILNMFYLNNFLHDLFYLLGFREEDGNFQSKGIGGVPGDPVDARAHSGPVWGTANMLTPPDGTSPIMNMGLVASTSRHTAFDATVVFHEFMHGVTNRLVGGALNTHALEQPQSKAMGEGWGDYLACTLTSKKVVGAWVTNQPAGIRSHPYDEQYSGTYGMLGTGIYVQPHRVGEIWCAALLSMNRNLNARLGEPRGQRLALQIVVDALKLAPANPNMLEMRDSILLALDHKRNASPGLSDADYQATKTGIWTAFAKYGMGAKAQSAGAEFGNIVENFEVPAGSSPPPNTGSTSNTSSASNAGTSPATSAGTIQLKYQERTVIPDNLATGVTTTRHCALGGTISRIEADIDIAHAYVGDLVVKLIAPGQPHIVLHNQAFSEAPDLKLHFTSGDRLAPLLHKPAQGDWAIFAADLSTGETGAIRGWSLNIQTETAGALSGFDVPPTPISDRQEALVLLNTVSDALGRLMRIIAS
ncbi:M36 family metallopeptidase [Bradyrhizobium tunisiense]|uniref:M36 family metallopeptidase n=1 Tax=Bradyrhizobium tunisiense TaxID=3278709 RepID=UPI0035D673E4